MPADDNQIGSVKMSDPSGLSRRLFSLGVLGMAAGGAAMLTSSEPVAAQTYYDASGAVIIVNPATITRPLNVYNAYGQPVVIYPTGPAYMPAPVYGPAGIVGQSRRVSRRTARRVSRRR